MLVRSSLTTWETMRINVMMTMTFNHNTTLWNEEATEATNTSTSSNTDIPIDYSNIHMKKFKRNERRKKSVDGMKKLKFPLVRVTYSSTTPTLTKMCMPF